MARFSFEILTPSRKVYGADVTEVLLPAHDGEAGILPDHGDFVGVLGTGALKIVENGDDYWYMVSSGIYEVKDGAVTVFADIAESAREVDVDASSAQVKELEKKFSDTAQFSPDEYPAQKLAYDRAKARLEVHRRTDLVN